MENVIVNHRRVVTANKRNKADTLKPKGAEAAREIFAVPKQTDITPPGSLMAPKTSALFATWNWVSPMRSSIRGIDPVKGRNGAEGIGTG